ncbi:hypothetical protein RNJ44_04270 [Nakaseomyces bracarensis]|uniref:PQ loop repeat protein n=1 Tax=Nakaseomyces bracarensis TaxID=273131 RepID=A0ABR4NUF1_9SACH
MISERAATVLATIATVCWCVQLIPQIIYNWKRKDCTGLPPLMMFLWVVSGIPFAIYFCVSKGNVVLQIQPHLFMFFCGISFVQSCYYPPCSMDRKKIVAIVLGIIACDVGMEVGFILWLRPLYSRGITWPDLIFGIIATVLLGVGLLPPYFELAKRKGRVVGINFAFLFIDSLGAWLSIVSVVVGNMDVMGIILYCVIAGLELGIFFSHFIWCCRFKWFGNHTEEELEADENSHNNEKTLDEKAVSAIPGEKFDIDHAFAETEEVNDTDELRDDASSIFDYDLERRPSHMERFSHNVHAVHGVVMQRSTDYSSVEL